MCEFRSRLRAALFVFLLSAPGVSMAQGPAQAYISADEHGQALLLRRLGACYAVTPAHVMGKGLFATLVAASPSAPQGDADLLQAFGYDLALLRTAGAVTDSCGGALTDAPQLDSVLAKASTAIVSSVNGDGSLTRRNVTINDVGLVHVRLRPRGEADQLFKGLSGSLVLSGEKPIGILMSVDPETGEGRALRYDRAIETLRPFFAAPGAPVRTHADGDKTTIATGAGLAAEVTSWSSPPIEATYRAANLIDATDSPSIWLARAENFPVEVVVSLRGDKAHAIDAVKIIGKGVDPAERLPKDFEVLVSGGSGWISVGSGTYFKNDSYKLVRFAPVRARQIMLRLYSNWGAPDAVGLSGIEVEAMR